MGDTAALFSKEGAATAGLFLLDTETRFYALRPYESLQYLNFQPHCTRSASAIHCDRRSRIGLPG
jgi:hypothetical protein